MSLFLHRQDESGIRSGRTNFNQTITQEDNELTSVGHMPIVQAPAHDIDALNTVVQRCKHVATVLGQQQFVVLTVVLIFEGQLCGEESHTKFQPSGSRPEPGVAEWHREKGRRYHWYNQNTNSTQQMGLIIQPTISHDY